MLLYAFSSTCLTPASQNTDVVSFPENRRISNILALRAAALQLSLWGLKSHTYEILDLLGCYESWIESYRLDPWRWKPTSCSETSVTTNLRRVTSQKSKYRVNIAAEVCNRDWYIPVSSPVTLTPGTVSFLLERKLPPRLNWTLPFPGLLRVVKWIETDVSGLPSWTSWPFKIGPLSSPETSVSNHLTPPRNNPGDGRIHTSFFFKPQTMC